MRVYSKIYANEVKCGGCNWSTSTLYTLGRFSRENGLCNDCFLEMLIENKWDVDVHDVKKRIKLLVEQE